MQVIWQPKATKQLLKVGDHKLRQRISAAVAKLEAWPECPNIKPLINHRYDFRLRVGNWRVFFDLIEGLPVIISVEEVKKRDERTY
jgi:mRNA-degrading endonuclease RelE of RelBE toxin-antitoxin system